MTWLVHVQSVRTEGPHITGTGIAAGSRWEQQSASLQHVIREDVPKHGWCKESCLTSPASLVDVCYSGALLPQKLPPLTYVLGSN